MLPLQETVTPARTYNTLADLEARRNELSEEIAKQDQQFSALWSSLFVKREATTRTEFVGSMISHGITAFDTFLLVRKLYKNYGGIFRRSKKKKR